MVFCATSHVFVYTGQDRAEIGRINNYPTLCVLLHPTPQKYNNLQKPDQIFKHQKVKTKS